MTRCGLCVVVVPAKKKRPRVDEARFEALYFDLLVRILGLLSGREIASCRKISHAIKDTIESSTLLLYKIECALAGVVDGPDKTVGLRDRLERLKKWQGACRHLRWTPGPVTEFEGLVPNVLDSILGSNKSILIFGSTYGEFSGDKITIFQPLSEFRGVPERQWTVSGIKSDLLSFAYSHDHKLLVTVHRAGLNACEVRLLSSETGENHPSASVSTLRQEIQVYTGSSPRLSIHCSTLAIASDSEVWILNWMTGDLLMFIPPAEISTHDVVLLDATHCAVTLAWDDSEEDVVFRNSVVIFRIEPGAPVRHSMFELLGGGALLVLHLPDLTFKNYPLQPSYAKFGHGLRYRQSHPMEGLFHRDEGNELLHLIWSCSMEQDGYDIHSNAHLVISTKALRSLISFAMDNNVHSLHWAKWAVYCRVFFDPFYSVAVSVVGTKYSSFRLLGAQKSQPWSVFYDFHSPASLRRDYTLQATRPHSNESIVLEEDDLEHIRLQPWQKPTRTGGNAPYRKIANDVPVCHKDEVFLGDDYMVVFRRREDGTWTKQVYSI